MEQLEGLIREPVRDTPRAQAGLTASDSPNSRDPNKEVLMGITLAHFKKGFCIRDN